MCHHGDQRAARVLQVLDRAHRFGELHQREDSLLHTRAARCRDRDHRHAACGRAVTCTRELLADRAAHRAAHEREVHHRQLARPALDLRLSDQHRLAEPGLELRLGESLRVRAQVEEVERIFAADVRRLFDERTLVRQRPDPRACLHLEVVAAVRTDPQVGVELVVAIVRLALGAGVRMLLARRVGRAAPVLDRNVDPGGGHELSSLDGRRPAAGCSASEAERGGQTRHGLDVGRLEAEAAEAGAQDIRPSHDVAQETLHFS